MATKPFQSKLIPYEEEIMKLRRRRPPMTYASIAEILRQKYNLTIHRSAICKFIKVRKRGRKVFGYWPVALKPSKERVKRSAQHFLIGSQQSFALSYQAWKETVKQIARWVLALFKNLIWSYIFGASRNETAKSFKANACQFGIPWGFKHRGSSPDFGVFQSSCVQCHQWQS